jgi:hypothetical protein
MKLLFIAKNAFYWSLLIIGLWQLCSCASSKDASSPCYSQTHYVGYGPGGWTKGRSIPR